MATNPTIKPKRGTTAPGPGSISQNELAVNTVSQSVYIGSVSGSGILVGSAPQGSSTQVQFNSSGVFAGSSNFTFDGSGVNVNGIVSSGLGISTSATTFNIVTDTASTINIGTTSGSTISIGNASGTTTIRNAGTNLNGTLTVTGATVVQGALSTNGALSVTGTSTLIGDITASGDIAVNGGDITSTATTFNLLNATVTNANVLGASNTVVIGGTGGAATIRNAGTNINGTLTVTGVSVIQGAVSLNSNLTVTGATTLQSTLGILGNTLSSSSATFNLLNTTVTNANVLGAATRVVIGANSSGDALIRNSNILLGGTVTGTTTISTTTGTVAHLVISPQGNFTLSPSGSIGAGGIRPSVTVPNNSSGTGTISISGAYVLVGNRNDGGSDYSGEIRIQEQSGNDYVGLKAPDTMAASTTYTLPSAFPASAGYVLQSTTTGLMSWAAPSLSASVGVTATSASSNYKLVFTDVNATNTSASLLIDTTSGIVYNPSTDALIVNGPLSTNSTLSVTGEATFVGSVIANGGTITSSATTFNLLNTTVTNANVLGAANTVVIGGTGGSTTIRNASTNINGTLTVSGNATFLGSALYTDTILAIGNQINIANAASGRVAFGDYDGAGNSTFVFIRDATSSLLISNPYGDVGIGDPNNVDSGYALLYNAAAGYLDGGNSSLTNFSSGSFNGLLTASAGISVSGTSYFSDPSGIQLTATAPLRFYDADSSHYVAFKSGATVTSNITWTLPTIDGTSSQVLSTNGSGTLSWSTPSGGGSSVTSLNGLIGSVTLAAGTNITITSTGNTITVASAPNSTTQTLDFSENINGLEIVIYSTGDSFGTSLQYIEKLTSIVVTVNSYSCTLVSIKSFYDATNGWSARLIVKPPFTNNVSAETLFLLPIESITITGNSGAALVDDVWYNITSSNIYHQDATYVTKTVTGQTWVTANSYIECKILGLTTADHTPEDAILEGVKFEITNTVTGTGFDIMGYAPEGTYGKYTIKCLSQ